MGGNNMIKIVNNLISKLPYRLSSNGLLVLFCLISVFHILVIIEVIPFAYVWAGKLKSKEEMYQFETVSLLLNIIMTFVVLAKMGLLKVITNSKLLKIILIAMSLLFLLNTIGNFFSVTGLELFIATPMTFLLSVLSYRLSLEV